MVTIKSELIGLMISVPPQLQSQLGEAISVIADSDFYERWDTLVDDLVSRQTPDNIIVNTGVLQVAHSIFSRWRPLFRSDELYTEIIHVLTKFAKPFLSLWQSLDAYIETNQANKEALQKAFQELDLVLKLFYDLSCQDLPPDFSDKLEVISGLLLKYLTYDNALLQTDDDTEAGPLENTKADVFEALSLYVGKYYEDFGSYVRSFVESSWTLLTTTSSDAKNDILVSKALQFLTSVTKINEQAQIFSDQAIQTQIVEKVILPNLALRDSDIEMFEDEPIDFIRRDLEGSDSETRRRAATDFLKQLMEQFEQPVTTIVMSYVEKFLAESTTNPTSNWRSKDTAVYLFCSIAGKGVSTASHGVTKTNSLVNIGDFFSSNLAGDLTGADVQPILKVDAIKYLYLFRSLITKEQWQSVLPLLVNRLGDSNYVVHTYAAIVLERVLYLTEDTGKSVVDPSNITPLSKDLLEHLFSLIENDKAPEKVQENEYLMRCVMRVLIVIKEAVSPVAEMVLKHLVYITTVISENPSNPRFYYYHFESVGALIRYAGASQIDAIATALYTPFISILQKGIEEFMPYVFQIFAALLEAQPTQPLPPQYVPLVAPIIAPPLWEQRGNVPALVRLLTAIIPRYVTEMATNNQLEPTLGLFQKLVSTKVYESYGFDLLECVIETFPPATLEQYWIHLLNLMLTRLQTATGTSFQLRFIRFYHFISARSDLGTDFFVAATDKVQQDVFRGLYLQIILPKTQELARPLDRKLAAVSFTKSLADSKAFSERYPKGWGLTCNALLKLLENPPEISKGSDTIVDHDVDDNSFGVGFTQLQTIKRPISDPYADVTDLRRWVGQYLTAANGRNGGRTAEQAKALAPEGQQVLAGYMQL